MTLNEKEGRSEGETFREGSAMNVPSHNGNERAPGHLQGLLRHFADLRDGIHGNGAVSRAEKEQLFSAAVDYLGPYCCQALAEMNETLLLGSGTISVSGLIRAVNGDCTALWTLLWPEQQPFCR